MVAVTAKSRTITNDTDNDATPVEANFVELYNNDATLATAVTTLETQASGASSYTGLKTFNDGIKTDTIGEKTSDAGVTIDGLLVKNAGITCTDAGALTIASGVITVTGMYHTVDTEASAATDDLDTINGGAAGKLLILQSEADARNVVIKHNTGNIYLANGVDFTLDITQQSITLIYSAALSKWVEVSRSKESTFATQSDQETATSTTAVVTSGRQQFHPSAAKAWVMFNGTGTIAINASYNVSSIADNGVGTYGVVFTTAFSSANYGAAGLGQYATGNQPVITSRDTNGSVATTSFAVSASQSTGRVDVSDVRVVFYGDQ